MGLDMYLKARSYVSGFPHQTPVQRDRFDDLLGASELAGLADPESPGATVEVTVCYWRRANAIHRWFVENVQGGEDECRPHPVEREQLERLRGLCRKVLDDPASAPALLPTRSGFFFGDTAYGESYLEDLRHTVERLDLVLAREDLDDFVYRASW